jgi:hypothetical protein
VNAPAEVVAVMVALSAPVAEGENVTGIWRVPPLDNDAGSAGAIVPTAKSVLELAMPVTVTAPPAVIVIVVVDELPTITLPK